MIDFTMPSLGADMEDAVLVEWKKHVGDHVERGDIIAEVETQKGDIEIEVYQTGTIAEIMRRGRTARSCGNGARSYRWCRYHD